MSDQGYVDYFEILGVPQDCKAGEVRNIYKKKMKSLVMEIAAVEITQDVRDKFLLDLATMNAAFFILRDNHLREQYVAARERVMQLEVEWRAAVDSKDMKASDSCRKKYDAALRDFLSTYLEELLLEAGRDKECMEASNWDHNHERHASRVLRKFRQQLYQQIHERLPFHLITEPKIDWDERTRTVTKLMTAGA